MARSSAVQKKRSAELVKVTPKLAVDLLENNKLNRPLTQNHVNRIANQITAGKWKYNGDTIKVGQNGDVLDGQHRLWAIVEANKPVQSVIVYGIPRDAFATIDSIRKPRSGADILALNGLDRWRRETSAALTWLLRWQRGVITEFRAPVNRIENSDIEEAYASHPDMERAVERIRHLRGIISPSLIAFVHYIVASRDPALADRMVETLESPAGVATSDPFFRLRVHLVKSLDGKRRREPLVTIALCIKAANAAAAGRRLENLSWRNQGKGAEPFPTLEV